MKKSLAGYLLIASQYLGDANFNRAVILLLQHSEEGAFGLVLNRPTNYIVSEECDDLPDEFDDIDSLIHYGGPVEGPLMALHTLSKYAEHTVLPGVHFAASRENLLGVLQHVIRPHQFFSGYSGWAPTQLESELEEGAWFTHRASRKHIFADSESDLWKRVAQAVGEEAVLQQLNIKQVPSDPSLN